MLCLPQIVEDVPPLPLNLPLVLVKPKEECSTAEVYKVSYTRYAFEDTAEFTFGSCYL